MNSPRFGPFSSFNYRLFYAGQSVSLIGTWMQQVAASWLVLSLSHSGTVLGLFVAAQMLPVLLLGSYGGLIADRMNKRTLLMTTQVIMGSVSLVNGVLTATHTAKLWMVVCLAIVLGITNAAANPTRQSFVSELVAKKHLRQAVSLNSVLVNTARAIGPAVAGVLIARVGVQACFFIDATSYLFVIAALSLMNTAKLSTPEPASKKKGQIREGLRYVRQNPVLLYPLAMMLLVGTFTYEFQVLLPLVATRTFHGGPGSLGALTSAFGIGAIVGGLIVAKFGHTGIGAITRGAALFCGAMILAAVAPTFTLELVCLFLVGASSIQFLSVGNSTIQLEASPQFRGRVMALWSIAFLGSTPVGGPIAGWIGQHLSPRLGLAMGGLACAVAVAIGLSAMRKLSGDSNGVGVIAMGKSVAEAS